MTAVERKILVVDDEVEVCNFVKMFFEERGFSVFEAHDGDEAVKVAREKKPQVILLDIRMRTNEEGFLVVPRLREAAPGAKILAVTAVEDEASVLRGKALGMDDYITKPLILEYLEKTVLRKIQEATSSNAPSRDIPT